MNTRSMVAAGMGLAMMAKGLGNMYGGPNGGGWQGGTGMFDLGLIVKARKKNRRNKSQKRMRSGEMRKGKG